MPCSGDGVLHVGAVPGIWHAELGESRKLLVQRVQVLHRENDVVIPTNVKNWNVGGLEYLQHRFYGEHRVLGRITELLRSPGNGHLRPTILCSGRQSRPGEFSRCSTPRRASS